MKTVKIFVLVLIMVCCFGSMSLAQRELPFMGSITTELTEEASIFILPGGAGPPLSEAMYFGGQPANARIELVVVDFVWNPFDNFPHEDIWLAPETSTHLVCPGGPGSHFDADVDTNVEGETYFENPLNGGGWTEGPIWVYLLGDQAATPEGVDFPPLPLRFNSADINADGVVGLPDLGQFATDFFGEYQYRSDFLWDGVLNLSDVGMLAFGMGALCE